MKMNSSGRQWQKNDRVAAILLAAGKAHRMRGLSKPLLPVHSIPIVRILLDKLIALPFYRIIVVTRENSPLSQIVQQYRFPVLEIRNPEADKGMAYSIRYGVGAAPRAAAYLFVLADMPFICKDTIYRLVIAHLEQPGKIIVPAFYGKRGNPVLFPKQYRSELLSLEGDTGAKVLLERHSQAVSTVSVLDPGILVDIDTPEQYRWLSAS